ncbi:uncharacterized protein CMU_037760 [Cryptosporidium muris RN66]|uniref:Uncharacterized protein n=1 Tax=Cryptosporidium muris (strain RN66) TaxID=441375 RepID=B6A920_CRYMR|nr:uncharacterized protein CMU_037760 [Cryptosporidium muris RN66]EEA04711.1 hypothetical protein, conserved [Cryptosporidium muris RN66]|eukprot:XP_002139060.1 hypothetical protein [Cryptosporidium muris RN66]
MVDKTTLIRSLTNEIRYLRNLCSCNNIYFSTDDSLLDEEESIIKSLEVDKIAGTLLLLQNSSEYDKLLNKIYLDIVEKSYGKKVDNEEKIFSNSKCDIITLFLKFQSEIKVDVAYAFSHIDDTLNDLNKLLNKSN